MKSMFFILGAIMIMVNWALTAKQCLSLCLKESPFLKNKESTLYKLVEEEITPYIYLLPVKRLVVVQMPWASLVFQLNL
jgi:hypothetical protein